MTKEHRRALAKNALTKAYQVIPAKDASKYRVNWKLYLIVLEELLEHVGTLEGKRVLDVGAGRGTLALAIAFLGAETIALEKYVFEHSTSEMFKEGGEEDLLRIWREHGVRPIIEDLFLLEKLVEPGSFDAVISVEVIEHVKGPKRLIDQMCFALKPNAIVIIATPNYARLHARLRLLAGQNPKIDIEPFYLLGESGFIGHWREYLLSELEVMLRLSDMQPIRAFTFCDPWYAFKKRVSIYSIKQTVIHLFSYLLPRARYEALVVARKKSR